MVQKDVEEGLVTSEEAKISENIDADIEVPNWPHYTQP